MNSSLQNPQADVMCFSEDQILQTGIHQAALQEYRGRRLRTTYEIHHYDAELSEANGIIRSRK